MLIQQFKCYLINNQYNKDEINEFKNESKIIIIDKIEALDNLFVIFFDQTIILMTKISELANLLNNFNESIIYTLSENVNSCLPANFQNKIYLFKDSEKKVFSDTIKSFSIYCNRIVCATKEIQGIWKLILPCFSSYFIIKSYRKLQNKQFDNNQTKFIENDFIVLQLLGIGSSAKVDLAFNIKNEELVAIKTFNNSTSYNREYEFYKKIHHQSIPHFYGTIEKKEILIIEYIRGETLKKIRCDKLTNISRFDIIFQLLIIFEYLQFHKIVYRDLKPSNLIVDENNKITLIDFDQTINMDEIDENKTITLDFSNTCACPELKNYIENNKYSFEMDVYSIGILIYYIFFNEEPKIVENDKIDTNSYNKFEQQYSPIKKICFDCTETKQSNRPFITKLIDYFFNFFIDHCYGQKAEYKSTPEIYCINKCKFFPLWIEKEDEFKSFNNIMHSFIYSDETKKIHLFFQFDLGIEYYPEEYFKLNIKKIIHYLTLLNDENNPKSIYYLGEIYYLNKYITCEIEKAIYYFTLAASQNNLNAQYYLGIIYYEDKYSIQNIRKAIYYFTLAANKNNQDAQYYLGIIYLEDKYSIQNIEKAIYYLTLAANQNNLDAQFILGFIYLERKYAIQNNEKAIYYFTLAANQNHRNAQFILGLIYYDARDIYQNIEISFHYFVNAQNILEIIYLDRKYIKQDINKAIYYYKLAANQNDINAQYALGKIYEDGKHINQDINMAIHYYTLAANQNQPNAHFNLGNIYLENKYIKRNIQKAIHYFTLAANLNDSNAQFKLGIIYFDGKYIKTDIKKAIQYFTLAANQNDSFAQILLGIIYSDGKYIKKDIKKAIHYVTLAADQNDSMAQNILGIYYYNGNYISQDINKSIHYLTLAANQNYDFAEYILGQIYCEGKYIKQDIYKAINYFKLSADHNNPKAQLILGKLYLDGIYLTKNINKASNYLNLAAKQNINEALFLLGVIYSKGEKIPKDMDLSISYYNDASSYNISKAKNNLAMIYLHAIGVEKSKQYAIVFLDEAIKLNDKLSMYNLAHIYLYDENEKTKEIIELLIESSFHYNFAFELLSLFLIKIHKKITYEKIENEIKNNKKINHDQLNKLTNNIYKFILKNNLENPIIFEQFYFLYRDIDYIYDWNDDVIETISLTEEKKNKNPKTCKTIDNNFYKGFDFIY